MKSPEEAFVLTDQNSIEKVVSQERPSKPSTVNGSLTSDKYFSDIADGSQAQTTTPKE
jgi:hypothetical protein